MTAGRAWHAGIDIGGSQVRLVTDLTGGQRRPVLSADIPDSYPQLLGVIGDLLARARGRGAERPAAGRLASATDDGGPGVAAPGGPTATATAECDPGPPAAVACGLPGTSHSGRAVFLPALPWLEGRPLADDLAELFSAPVTLAVDGHLTLLAETAEGAACGRSSAVLVAVGTGIGGALMIGGRIWRGYHGSGGAWGWLPHPGAAAPRGPDSPLPGGGVDAQAVEAVTGPRHGEFELAASGTALDRKAAGLAAEIAGHAGLAPSGRDLVSAARSGQPAALAVIGSYAADLGRGLASLASTLDPEIILVGGGLSAAMDVLGPAIEQAMGRLASPDGRGVPVRAAALGPDAGAIGAWHAARRGTGIWL